MIKYFEDLILAHIQKRCPHPGEMVAVDILEGCSDYEVAYCRRCGGVQISHPKYTSKPEWRLPSPHLWRGYHPTQEPHP